MIQIVWTKSARQDVNEIWDYLVLRNPNAAELTDSQIGHSLATVLKWSLRRSVY